MNKKGFTLTELVATMVILGIVHLIAVPSYNGYTETITIIFLGLLSEYARYNTLSVNVGRNQIDGISNYTFTLDNLIQAVGNNQIEEIYE